MFPTPDCHSDRSSPRLASPPSAMEQLASLAELQATLDAAFALIDDCLPPSAGSVVDAFSELCAQCEDASSDETSTSSQSSASPPSSPTPSPFADGDSPTKPAGRSSSTIRETSRRGGQVGITKAPAPKRATFQVRQKQEIAQLRQEAVQLEAYLGLMSVLKDGARANTHRAIHDRPSSIGGTLVMAAGNKPSRPELACLWKDMAARHKKLRGVSEGENMKLRLQVSEQLKAIRSIQKLLRRQATRDVRLPESVAGWSCNKYSRVFCDFQSCAGLQVEPIPRPVKVVRTDTPEAKDAVMAMLSDEIDAMYRGIDVAIQLCGLGTLVSVPIQERLTQPSPSAFAAQMIESRLMPFNFRDTAETMWDFSTSMCTNTDFFQKQARAELEVGSCAISKCAHRLLWLTCCRRRFNTEALCFGPMRWVTIQILATTSLSRATTRSESLWNRRGMSS
jgi:hypothetical protein